MVDQEVLQRKLAKMREYLEELKAFENLSWEDYRENSQHRRAVERLIQLIVDVAVDINTHSIVDGGEPPPANAFDSFLRAASLGLFPQAFAEEIAPSTGERNIIVHEYESIDDSLVYHSIDHVLAAYHQYLKYLKRFL